MDSDDRPHPLQIEIYRSMSPEQKWRIMESLNATARKVKAAWLRSQHPDWSEEEIDEAVRKIFLHART